MNAKSTLVRKLSKLTLAAAMVAALGTSMAGAFDSGEYANLSREDALKFAQPYRNGSFTDREAKNMSVVGR